MVLQSQFSKQGFAMRQLTRTLGAATEQLQAFWKTPGLRDLPATPTSHYFLSYLSKSFNFSESLFSITQVIPTLKDYVKLQGGVISGFTIWNGPSGMFVFFLSSSLLFYFLSAACF